MLDFSDIAFVDPIDVQIVLNSIDHDSLAIALKGEADNVRDLILSAMSKAEADDILSNMDFLGAVRASAVHDAQSEIAALLNRLHSEGRIRVCKPPPS